MNIPPNPINRAEIISLNLNSDLISFHKIKLKTPISHHIKRYIIFLNLWFSHDEIQG